MQIMFKYCKTVTVFLPYHVLTSHMYLYMVDDDPSVPLSLAK